MPMIKIVDGEPVEMTPEEEAEFLARQPPPPTAEGVRTECDRRLAAGFDYDFGDARGVHRIATTERDMKGWDEVTKVAGAAVALGQEAKQVGINTETGPVSVTALEWQQLLLAAYDFRNPIWQASFALQAMDPIPADFAADTYWP
jgi:hypothetical protein